MYLTVSFWSLLRIFEYIFSPIHCVVIFRKNMWLLRLMGQWYYCFIPKVACSRQHVLLALKVIWLCNILDIWFIIPGDVLWCPMTFDCFLFVFPLILNLFMKLFVTSPVDLKRNPKLPDCEVVLTVVVVDYPLLREACRPSSISLVLCTRWCYHT